MCHALSWTPRRCRPCPPWSWRWPSPRSPSTRPSCGASCRTPPWWTGSSLARKPSWFICVWPPKNEIWSDIWRSLWRRIWNRYSNVKEIQSVAGSWAGQRNMKFPSQEKFWAHFFCQLSDCPSPWPPWLCNLICLGMPGAEEASLPWHLVPA